MLRETLDRSDLAKMNIDVNRIREELNTSLFEKEKVRTRLYRLQSIIVWLMACVIFLVAILISNSISIVPQSNITLSLPQINDWGLILVFGSLVFPSAYTITRYFRRGLEIREQ